MAVNANCIYEVGTGGNDNNGGGFVEGASGTDRSQQDSAHATLTVESVVNSTTTIIDVDPGDHTCADADVGNIIQITGGTATAGFYEIKSRSAQQWTLDRPAGTAGQTVVGKMGGRLASPGKASGAAVSYNWIYILDGTYTISSGTVNVSNGVLDPSSYVRIYGRGSDRNDFSSRPLLQLSTPTSITVVNLGAGNAVQNIEVDGNSNSSVVGIDGGNAIYAHAIHCKVVNCTSSGFIDFRSSDERSTVVACVADNCNIGFQGIDACILCVALDCTSHGFYANSQGLKFINCIADSNGGNGFRGHRGTPFVNCVSYNNTSDGFWSREHSFAINCIAEGNGAYGFAGYELRTMNCAAYNNTSGDFEDTTNWNAITGTTSFFVDAANSDFRANNDVGGGADLRAAAYPLAWLGIGTAQQLDIGAAQHEDPAGGGSTTIINNPIRVM